MLAGVLACSSASSQTVAIVGTGTAACSRFNAVIIDRPNEEREYFAWAQGYMSGVLLSASAGVDDVLSLNPDAFPLAAQIAFVRVFCERFPESHYSDGVETLYRALGGKAIR